jgi:hypothetical protein
LGNMVLRLWETTRTLSPKINLFRETMENKFLLPLCIKILAVADTKNVRCYFC